MQQFNHSYFPFPPYPIGDYSAEQQHVPMYYYPEMSKHVYYQHSFPPIRAGAIHGFPGNRQPVPWKTSPFLSAFLTPEGNFDIAKTFKTVDQVVKTVNQVSPLVKQVTSLLTPGGKM